MNLHEECLLKYLSNPLELYTSMELLKMNNALLIKEKFNNEKKYNYVNLSQNVCRN